MLTSLTLLFAFTATGARAETGLTLTRRGLDAEGRSAYERFRVLPDGETTLETSARGSFCSGEGGLWSATLAPAQRGELGELARKLVTEQKELPPPPPAHSARDVRARLVVEGGGQVASVTIAGSSPSYAPFENAASLARGAMKPVSGVRMSVARKKDSLDVTFQLLGTKPFLLLLPEDADQGFTTAGVPELRYSAPPRELKVTLTPEVNKVTVVLTGLPGAIRTGRLRYSNTTFQHHAPADPLAAQAGPLDLSLCGTF